MIYFSYIIFAFLQFFKICKFTNFCIFTFLQSRIFVSHLFKRSRLLNSPHFLSVPASLWSSFFTIPHFGIPAFFFGPALFAFCLLRFLHLTFQLFYVPKFLAFPHLCFFSSHSFFSIQFHFSFILVREIYKYENEKMKILSFEINRLNSKIDWINNKICSYFCTLCGWTLFYRRGFEIGVITILHGNHCRFTVGQSAVLPGRKDFRKNHATIFHRMLQSTSASLRPNGLFWYP